MKIAIFETEHFEGAFPVIRLFDQPGNEIMIITTEETKRRFDDLLGINSNRYGWSVLPTGNKCVFFHALYKAIMRQKPDLVYLNTISNNHFLYALVLAHVRNTRILLTVHDINCLFESRLEYKFREAVVHKGKRWLLKQVNEFNVVSDTMVQELGKKVGSRPIHNVPGAVFEGDYVPQKLTGALRLVVPGSLDRKRRDYEQVFELAELAGKVSLALEIVLLGGARDEYGTSVRDRASKFHSPTTRIITYPSAVVDQHEFDDQLKNAHFVLIPSVIHTTICGNIPEIYGVTKSSGNIYDVIKHARPFIVPEKLTVSPDLTTSCFKYSSVAHLIEFLQFLTTTSEEYERWQQEALNNSQHYTIERVRGRNGGLFGAGD
ncbi:MAG: glycosyltransferase [Chitinophagaceae bacterium]|nr:glycosyltransferase [Chitinophagaceae bacterium]